MPVDSPPLSVPAFGAAFWQPYVPVVRQDHAAAAGDTGPTTGLRYSAPLHGSHADFLASEDFKRYEQEVRDSLSFLVDFCQRHGVPDTQKIEENFNTFFSHRFVDHHYFDTRAEIVDSIGKQSLDEFCSMVRNEAIEAGQRTAAIRNLSYGVTLCADGAISSLVSAACLLAKAVGGIRGKLWELKEETAVHVLQKLIEQRFGQEEDYLGYEIHYVNTARNIIADDFGLEKTPDGIVLSEVALDDRFLDSCVVGIARALTPDRLARLIAEDCHARFHSRLAMARIPATGAWDTGIEKRFSEFLEEIGNELGLTSAGELEFAPYAEGSTLREGDLRMKSFLDIGQDDGLQGDENNAGAYTYVVRTDPALIALDVLRAMDGLKLLRAQDGLKESGEWVDENGRQATLFVYGELAWVARTQPGEHLQDPLWNNKNAGFGLMTWTDLLRRQAARPDDSQPPPVAAIRQAIDATAAEPLTQMPAHLLENAENLQRFLQRLGTGQAADYLTKNLRVITAIGTGFTNPEREAVLAHILRAGLGNAVRVLIALWLQDGQARTDMIYAVLLREAVPALHKAMQQEDPRAAVQAWYRGLRHFDLLSAVASRVVDLLNTPYSGAPILWHALSNGQTAAVEAFLSLVKELLKDFALQWNMKNGMPDLLRAQDASNKPGLWKAMADGRTATVQAFYTGLEDLLADKRLADAIHPSLMWSLPDLLVGKKYRRDSGLAYAVQRGYTGVILALHATLKKLLSDRHIAVHLQPHLYDVLAAQLPGRASALSEAMKSEENMAAIEAVYAVLKDPIIMLPIQRDMPNLLNRMDSNGKTGVSNALEHGHAGIIDGYHALLAYLLREPAVAQHIRGFLVPMLTARNEDGTTGLAYASEHGYTDAIAAYRAMLEDPDIFQHIKDHVADLLDVEARPDDPRDAASPDLGPDLDWNMDPDAGVAWHPDGDVLDLN